MFSIIPCFTTVKDPSVTTVGPITGPGRHRRGGRLAEGATKNLRDVSLLTETRTRVYNSLTYRIQYIYIYISRVTMDYKPTKHDSGAPPLCGEASAMVTIPKNYIEVYEFGFTTHSYNIYIAYYIYIF
jgi:hypothetical protein